MGDTWWESTVAETSLVTSISTVLSPTVVIWTRVRVVTAISCWSPACVVRVPTVPRELHCWTALIGPRHVALAAWELLASGLVRH